MISLILYDIVFILLDQLFDMLLVSMCQKFA